jgi:cell division protein FtsA
MNAHSLFHSQRAMRRQREAAVRRGVVAVLDIGTSKLACLILQFTPERQAAERGAANDDGLGGLAQGAFRVIGAHNTRSRGVDFGEVSAMDETERAIRTAVQNAQKMAEVRVDHVIVGFSGGRPRSYGLSGDVRVENGEVTEMDVGAALAACDLPDFGDDREAIHAFPVNFTLDHRTGLSDPRGQIGNRLSVDMHLLTVDAATVLNVLQCIRRCDLELAGLVVSSCASGLSALIEDEQELGAACIDVGGGATGISIFAKRHMIYADSVRLGGDHITRDISQGLNLPLTVAERLKTVNGGLVATGVDDRDLIQITPDEDGRVSERRQITRSELIGVMRPRMEEILEEARHALDAAGFEYLQGQRVVLTGGSSLIPGMDVLGTRVLGRQVRIGKPLRVMGLPQAMTGPAFAGTVGLALHAAHPQDECWDFELPSDRMGARKVRRAIRWFKDNW